jgi:hypothetical protein
MVCFVEKAIFRPAFWKCFVTIRVSFPINVTLAGIINTRAEVYTSWPVWTVVNIISGKLQSFHTRFKEHVRDYQMGYQKSLYAKHLLDNKHTLHSIEDSWTIFHHTKKGRLLNTIEKFHIYIYIYKETKTGNQLNDCHTVTYDAIFKTLLDPTPFTPLLTGLLQHYHLDVVYCKTHPRQQPQKLSTQLSTWTIFT